MNIDFIGKKALVTGGTSGIGKEISKYLLNNGANVIINYCQNIKNMKMTKK